MPGLQVGDMVAVHWGQVVKVLKDEEVKGLKYWTKKLLRGL